MWGASTEGALAVLYITSTYDRIDVLFSERDFYDRETMYFMRINAIV